MSSPYDEQIGLTLTQDFSSLAYNVTAVAQSSSDGVGPAYLLNGLTDQGYWYQVGVSYDWPYSDGGYDSGFNVNYEVFDSSGNSIFPANGGGGLASFSGKVHDGDLVALSLRISGGSVALSARDLATGASAAESYGDEGAFEFVGLSQAGNGNGFFTGLMTEWYHSQPYYGNVQAVVYTDRSAAKSSAIMWIDEYNVDNQKSYFNQNSGVVSYSEPESLHGFSLQGATAFSNAYEFITGPQYYTLTASYAVSGGGSGFSPPSLTYMHDGTPTTVELSEQSRSFTADAVSSLLVNEALPGSTQTERWAIAPQQSNLTLTSSESIVFTYSHQFLLTVGSGSGTLVGSTWYESGSQATDTLAYSWGNGGTSRLNAVSYTLDGATTDLSREGSGFFSVQVLMTSSHVLEIASVTQYPLSVSGGNSTATAPASPTSDGWFDSGTVVSATTRRSALLEGGLSRDDLASYTLDGATASQDRNATGPFSLQVVMDRQHTVSFGYVKQYLVTATFTDASNSTVLHGVDAFLSSSGFETQNGTGRYWVDAGSSLSVAKAVWEGVDVLRSATQPRVVDQPLALAVPLEVYGSAIKVTDLLGVPVAGARVQLTLANGSAIARTTDSGGTAIMGLEPGGSFSATVTYLGLSTTVLGTVAQSGQYFGARLPFSLPTLSVAAGVVVTLVAAVFLRRKGQRHNPN
jgi:hypothetical protein